MSCHTGPMAGFDFDFIHTDAQAPYVEACVAAAKSRARQLGCRWRVQRLPGGGLRCVVDGQTRRLDLLGRALEHDLPSVCEGVRAGLSPSLARNTGLGFAALFLEGRDLSRDEGTQVLRARPALSTYYPLYDFVDGTNGSEALRARLRVTEDVVTDFGLGRYPPQVLLEELHTALEQTLRELLPSGPKRANWPTLLDGAQHAGFLSWSESDWYRVVQHRHSDSRLLADLTKRRNINKHRRSDPTDPWLGEHWDCVGYLLERLVRNLQTRP